MNQKESMLAQAKSWLNRKESDGSFKEIIDIYNEAARKLGLYIMSYADPWCAAFITACAWVCKLTDVVAPSASCDSMIAWYKKRGQWRETNYTPKPGDIVFYDWDGNTTSDHVGIISAVNGIVITIIEGNQSDAVRTRTITTNYNYIQGYGVPTYDSQEGTVETPTTPKPFDKIIKAIDKPCRLDFPMLIYGCGMIGKEQYKSWVVSLQQLLIAKHYTCGSAGDDGEFGNGTLAAVRNFQTNNGLTVDGIVGTKTWEKLMGG